MFKNYVFRRSLTNKFIGVLLCCEKHKWIEHDELETIMAVLGRWCDAERNGNQCLLDESELALMRIAGGVSRRMF